jgi:hypothetical protein
MSDRPTPETDAFITQNTTNEGPTGVKWRSHAERLERERDEARERERVAIASWDEERQRALREGERVLEARRERNEAHKIAERAIDDLAWFNYTNAQRLRAELNQLKEVGDCVEIYSTEEGAK